MVAMFVWHAPLSAGQRASTYDMLRLSDYVVVGTLVADPSATCTTFHRSFYAHVSEGIIRVDQVLKGPPATAIPVRWVTHHTAINSKGEVLRRIEPWEDGDFGIWVLFVRGRPVGRATKISIELLEDTLQALEQQDNDDFLAERGARSN